jgi:hypothetical protein
VSFELDEDMDFLCPSDHLLALLVQYPERQVGFVKTRSAQMEFPVVFSTLICLDLNLYNLSACNWATSREPSIAFASVVTFITLTLRETSSLDFCFQTPHNFRPVQT